MTSHDHHEFHSLLASLSDADVSTEAIPLESEAFWNYVIEAAAHGARPGSEPPVIAERLLRDPLVGAPSVVRSRAAIACLESRDAETRRRAMRLLAETDGSPEALAAAERAARDADEEVGAQALRVLIKHSSPATLPALLEALETRFDARETVASEGLVAAGAGSVPGLTAILEHDDERVRWRAARCLTLIAQAGHQETLPALLKAFHDDSPDVDWVAADGLLALGQSASVPVLRSVVAEPLTGGTIKALHQYASHASPSQVFKPLANATRGLGAGTSTLMAVDKALRALEETSAR